MMKTCTAIVTAFGILLAGERTAGPDNGDKPETVKSLLTAVVEAKDERLRKKAVEKLLKRENTSTPQIIADATDP